MLFRGDFVIDHLANRMLDIQVQFLRSIGAVYGNHDAQIDHRLDLATVASGKADRRDAELFGGVSGFSFD